MLNVPQSGDEKMKTSAALLYCALIVFVTGCATPQRRIEKNPEIFASFPEDVQENVRNGIIDLGYTKEMVLIALGKPNTIRTSISKERSAEIWEYTRTIRDWSPPSPPFRGHCYPFHSHWDRHNYYWWDDHETVQEIQTMKIDFVDGKVDLIEERVK